MFSEHESLNKFLYIIYGENNYEEVTTTVPKLTQLIKDEFPKDFRWKAVELKNEGHVPDISLESGLTAFFSEIILSKDIRDQGLESIIHYLFF